MLHSISPTPSCWQVPPAGVLCFQTTHPWSDLKEVLTQPLVLADQ
jgi:hypothetical protein